MIRDWPRARRTVPLAIALVAGFGCSAAPPNDPADRGVARFDWFDYEGKDPVFEQVSAGPDQYLNPILAGFYPDPSFCRMGDDYYLATSSFTYWPGVPIFHSRDLVNWTPAGSALGDAQSWLDFDGAETSRGIFAPTLRCHDDTLWMITTVVDKGGNFIVTAKDPAGPWSEPIFLPEVDGIDPSIFFDDDGRIWILNNGPPIETPRYSGHRAIWIQEFDPATKKMTGPRTMIVNGGVDLSKNPIWIEAPHIFKVDGQYYLICAEGGTAEQHSEVVFRSASPTGPYVPYAGNPILTQRHLDPNRPFPITTAGHADFVETQNGEWWAVFLGVRPYAGNDFNTGRETYLLPVKWVDGWPIILDRDSTVPYVVKRPNLPAQPVATIPNSGNYTDRDEFDGNALRDDWILMRTPRETWYDLDSRPGWLTLKARPVNIAQRAQPSFVGRRQRHAFSTVTTAMRFIPEKDGDAAGIAALQNDRFYYLMSVTMSNDRPMIQLEKAAGGPAEVVASAPLEGDPGRTIYLRIDARGEKYDFRYAYEPDAWNVLMSDADGKILSTKVAQGFVGAIYGLYAYADSVAPAR
jgi:alpha-N-arabinofuranosidase